MSTSISVDGNPIGFLRASPKSPSSRSGSPHPMRLKITCIEESLRYISPSNGDHHHRKPLTWKAIQTIAYSQSENQAGNPRAKFQEKPTPRQK